MRAKGKNRSAGYLGKRRRETLLLPRCAGNSTVPKAGYRQRQAQCVTSSQVVDAPTDAQLAQYEKGDIASSTLSDPSPLLGNS